MNFKPYDKLTKDTTAESTFRTWPKPLTIEFLEEQYQRWRLDLTSPCWEATEVSELGSSKAGNPPGPPMMSNGNGKGGSGMMEQM